MMYFSIALFALAAVFGIFILTRWFSGKHAGRSVVFSHGIAAVIGFLLLVCYATRHADSFPKISIILFAIAAVAGSYMFIRDLKRSLIR